MADAAGPIEIARELEVTTTVPSPGPRRSEWAQQARFAARDPVLERCLATRASRTRVRRGERVAPGAIILLVRLTPEIVAKWGGSGRVRSAIRLQGSHFLLLPRPEGVVRWGDKILLLGRPPHEKIGRAHV